MRPLVLEATSIAHGGRAGQGQARTHGRPAKSVGTGTRLKGRSRSSSLGVVKPRRVANGEAAATRVSAALEGRAKEILRRTQRSQGLALRMRFMASIGVALVLVPRRAGPIGPTSRRAGTPVILGTTGRGRAIGA